MVVSRRPPQGVARMLIPDRIPDRGGRIHPTDTLGGALFRPRCAIWAPRDASMFPDLLDVGLTLRGQLREMRRERFGMSVACRVVGVAPTGAKLTDLPGALSRRKGRIG